MENESNDSRMPYGEDRLLVTLKRWMSLRNKRLKFKALGKLLIILEGFKEYTYPQIMHEERNRKM